jgi:hypothetical protein
LGRKQPVYPEAIRVKCSKSLDVISSSFQLKLEQEDHLLMVRALANVLLLPWPAIPDQKWDDRARHLTKFLRDLTEPFRNLRNMPDFATSRELQAQGSYPPYQGILKGEVFLYP